MYWLHYSTPRGGECIAATDIGAQSHPYLVHSLEELKYNNSLVSKLGAVNLENQAKIASFPLLSYLIPKIFITSGNNENCARRNIWSQRAHVICFPSRIVR